jgi:hypothetical protein
MEFDVIVRDFNDTDDNMVVIERYARCSMNPDVPGFIAKKSVHQMVIIHWFLNIS